MTPGQAFRFVISHQGRIQWLSADFVRVMVTNPYQITIEGDSLVKCCLAIEKLLEEQESKDNSPNNQN